ncbi:hypothetical protein RRG08_028630 [Elysia crispata]|uniref:Uncharacterized protein n=1 Tax=Elysia crispata TaxID=231223 RepID=A0AAE0ZRW1_9GAST|nr:hypothetical protein RRG08_028630 [Elysia crispata]
MAVVDDPSKDFSPIAWPWVAMMVKAPGRSAFCRNSISKTGGNEGGSGDNFRFLVGSLCLTSVKKSGVATEG